MTRNLQQMYQYVNELVSLDSAITAKTISLRRAWVALSEELEHKCGQESTILLESMASLEAEIETCHEQALFEQALQLGMELGRMRTD